MNEFFSYKNYERIAWWIISLGFLIILVTMILFLKEKFQWFGSINTDKFDHFGSFIGGSVGTLFSLSGILLVLATLNEQKVQFKKLQEQSEKQQVENHFFQLLKIYQEEKLSINVDNITTKDKFSAFLKNFGSILESTRKNLVKFNLSELDQINISYLVFFFGYQDIDMEESLKKVLLDANVKSEIVDAIITNRILGIISQQEVDDMPSIIIAPGFSNSLGHYFRQLFHIINYIGDNKTLNPDEKYFYIRILRSQMSDPEQALFFFNSLSYLGKNWEKSRIIEYKLVHNAPDSLFFKINRWEYYPLKK